MIDQLAISIFSGTAIWLANDHRLHLRRYACFFGLASQPAWFFTAYAHNQWGVFAMSFWFTYAWLRGFYIHWVKK